MREREEEEEEAEAEEEEEGEEGGVLLILHSNIHRLGAY